MVAVVVEATLVEVVVGAVVVGAAVVWLDDDDLLDEPQPASTRQITVRPAAAGTHHRVLISAHHPRRFDTEVEEMSSTHRWASSVRL